jgi:hypothetical protein
MGIIRISGNKPIEPIGNAHHPKQSDISHFKTRTVHEPFKRKGTCILII